MGERTMKALLSRSIGSCAQAFAGVLAKCIHFGSPGSVETTLGDRDDSVGYRLVQGVHSFQRRNGSGKMRSNASGSMPYTS